ncbi:ankyrin-3-like [Haliotis rufescens]|uniref:ankyrin-3-like n=1 Tax=Haliotis rufescens TaxID=6454 RepID=UPI00201ED03B|nr:ankyrin-3-like [Haliotis rufescens]XP_048251590.1 ankyrin-3-like [Haliotis rufescens]XP_048251591.1 ankyrin-3-like [Haliotis rufescens]
MAESDPTILPLDAALSISPPTSTQPAATPTNTHLAATPTNTSSVCQLCRCIQNEDFTQARLMVRERSQEIFDPDKRAVYNIIHYYQTYLNSRSDGLDIPKSDLWKIPSISQSETRLQLLDILRLLLQADLDPNVKTGSETPLMAAVRTHDESLILILLQHGADPNLCDGREEMNAFALSIILNDVSTVEQLLHYGSNVNAVCCGTVTPLQLSMNKSVHISKLLLQSGADIQQVLTMPSAHEVQIMVPPLIQAVGRGNIYLVSVLLEHGEDVNQTYGDHSETPLHLAVKNGDYHMVEMLIQYGASLNKLSGRGHTALGLMLTSGSAGDNRIARLLLKCGCSRRRETIISMFQRSYPPIFVACFMGNKEIVDLLIEEDESQCDASRAVCGVQNMTVLGASVQEYGCDNEETEVEKVFAEKHLQTKSKLKRKPKSSGEPETMLNCTAADGCSPVIMAALGGHYTLVKHLLHLGADPHIICCHGNLTHAAVLSSSAESLDLLELATSLGCNLNLVNEYGNTPLHLSARINVPDVCRYLVEQGALLNVRDRFGETALSASVYFGCEDNSRILIQQGADMNIADSSGTTAMYWSIFNCREPTLRLLLSAGASFTPEQFTKYPRNLKVMRNEQLVTFIQESVCQPRSLAALAVFQVRQVISRVMGGRSVKDSVLQLPVPDKVKDSVLLLNDI